MCEKCSKDTATVPVCNPPPRSVFYSKKGQPAKALKPGYDAHFVPVQGPKFQACDPAVAEYYELVSQKELVLPMGILWVKISAAVSAGAVGSAAAAP